MDTDQTDEHAINHLPYYEGDPDYEFRKLAYPSSTNRRRQPLRDFWVSGRGTVPGCYWIKGQGRV